MSTVARTSKKDAVLAAAYEIVEEDGISAVTYDRLSEVTGMSKSGLIYHFPSRHDLLIAMHQHIADVWDAEIMTASGGRGPEELTQRERYRAALSTMSTASPLAELLMNIHAHSHPDFIAIWNRMDERWLPDPSEHGDQDLNFITASVLASGLWVHDHINGRPLSPEARAHIIDEIMALLDADEDSTD